jgi:hypothetical protein
LANCGGLAKLSRVTGAFGDKLFAFQIHSVFISTISFYQFLHVALRRLENEMRRVMFDKLMVFE